MLATKRPSGICLKVLRGEDDSIERRPLRPCVERTPGEAVSGSCTPLTATSVCYEHEQSTNAREHKSPAGGWFRRRETFEPHQNATISSRFEGNRLNRRVVPSLPIVARLERWRPR